MFPVTFPGTKCQVPGNQGHLSTSAMTGQRKSWGPNRISKSLSGVWDFRFCLFDDVRVAEEGGGNFNPNQATSTILVRIVQRSWKCSKLISICAWATIYFCSSTATETPEKKTSESTRQRWGAKLFCFSIVPENSQVLLDLAWKFLS